MKNIFAAAVAALMVLVPVSRVQAAEPSAACAVLMDKERGRVLYEKNAHEPRLIASITKLMTALVVLESGWNLNEVTTVPEDWAGVEGSSIYLRPGERVTMETLLYGMLLQSGNDAATLAAQVCAGSVEAFAEQMNAKAQVLGMKDSHFTNPTGLNDAGHYSTAYDMALLARACLDNEILARIVSTRSISLGGRVFTNHNKLLWQYEDWSPSVRSPPERRSGCVCPEGRRQSGSWCCTGPLWRRRWRRGRPWARRYTGWRERRSCASP